MTDYLLTYKPYGNQAILVEWPAAIDPNIIADVLAFDRVLNKEQKVKDTVIAYHSLLVLLNQPINHFEAWVEKLQSQYPKRMFSTNSKRKIWEVPVCYHKAFGLDLDNMSESLNLTKEEIIESHATQNYLVYFIGFQPGFLYLGGLSPQLHCPRKANPRLKVAEGSVAIGGAQTGVYPQETPGGWNILGKTPIRFFNVNSSSPCFAKPGDYIKFMPISKLEFEDRVKQKLTEPKYHIE